MFTLQKREHNVHYRIVSNGRPGNASYPHFLERCHAVKTYNPAYYYRQVASTLPL
jgi:hypothetical protein